MEVSSVVFIFVVPAYFLHPNTRNQTSHISFLCLTQYWQRKAWMLLLCCCRGDNSTMFLTCQSAVGKPWKRCYGFRSQSESISYSTGVGFLKGKYLIMLAVSGKTTLLQKYVIYNTTQLTSFKWVFHPRDSWSSVNHRFFVNKKSI